MEILYKQPHGKKSMFLIADDSLRRYNVAVASPNFDNFERKEDIEWGKADYLFPAMVSEEKAMEKYLK